MDFAVALDADLTVLAADAGELTREDRPAVLGITGPPGAGKSTLARAMTAALGGAAAYVPLDGFHLSNAQLDRLGLRERKGSEPGFDVWGYAALLRRLVADTTREVYVPDFDRALDEPVAARHRVPPETRLIVTEGNYLAVDLPGWREARALMDAVWYVDAPAAVRDARLMSRHTGFGRTRAAARSWIDANDGPNAALVAASRDRCDRVITPVVATHGVPVLPCAPDGPPLDGYASALGLIGDALGRGARLVAVPAERVADTFFSLRTGVAGEIAQKFTDYHLRLAIVGDISRHTAKSSALRDYVREADRGTHVWFSPTWDDLTARLRESPPPPN
ncbi:nucleoside/nucleotide kinase family protein [Streptomyces sp. NBC_01803]|uniref:nucleoside/nucleotide kinase family protein n=1 Tax=Streptomyces sp. NBC_01803 TaxID=2975946 RepID=UPI002DDBA092|nr:nucleoside/nucleotide kinase family protein [Streptomyces sp. NBC_01803]WSA43397.1 nucleoside/nucleotide kinase family protein [Streptomyces sp. NBC_01803]